MDELAVLRCSFDMFGLNVIHINCTLNTNFTSLNTKFSCGSQIAVYDLRCKLSAQERALLSCPTLSLLPAASE